MIAVEEAPPAKVVVGQRGDREYQCDAQLHFILVPRMLEFRYQGQDGDAEKNDHEGESGPQVGKDGRVCRVVPMRLTAVGLACGMTGLPGAVFISSRPGMSLARVLFVCRNLLAVLLRGSGTTKGRGKY